MRPTTIDFSAGDRIQWAQGSGGGVRSWAYHGVGKIHVLAENRVTTLCGRVPKWRNAWKASEGDVEREGLCGLCVRRLPAAE